MTQKLFYFLILFLFSACNVWSPLEAENDSEALIEAAQKCLHDGDYDCAIEKYLALPVGELRDRKLCTGYLVKGGFTLNSFLNVVSLDSSDMLGALAQSLVPWSEDRGDAAANAYTHCKAFGEYSTSGSLGVLLKTMGAYVDCASRISRTDLWVATSNADTSCSTPGNGDEIITQSDLGPAGGSISSGNPGMCASDVNACVEELSDLDSSGTSGELGDSGLGDIQGSFDSIPDELKDSNTTTDVGRDTIRGMLSSR